MPAQSTSDAWPDVWGAGQLLAFSGVDGPTDWAQPFVLHTARRPGALRVRLPCTVEIDFEGLARPAFRLVLGDAIDATTESGPFRLAFVDHHTLAGELPRGIRMIAAGRPVSARTTAMHEEGDAALFAVQSGTRCALHVASCAGKGGAVAACDAALVADLDALVEARRAFVGAVRVPDGFPAERTRLLRKALSVMKVNTHSACGTIGRRWTTPDRWPHRHMWLWDSAFHGVGLSYVDPPLAQDAVLAVLEQVRPDGMLPHMLLPDGNHSDVTQPPILAWAARKIFARSGDRDWAAECVPLLWRVLEWMRLNRDRNGNGIPEWFIEGAPLCRCGESGMDNSSVYDRAVLLDAADFAAYLCSDYTCLADLAAQTGHADIAASAGAHAAAIAAAVNATLWCDTERFYLHRDFDGAFVPVKAACGLMPLFAGIPDDPRAAALRDHLRNPATFGAPLPVPSESLDSGTYCKDMWRGPTWLNLSYFVVLGLRRYGYADDAARIKEALLAGVARWYEREGCIWEYYDSLDLTSPRDLDRKQRLSSGHGIAPISDYHWTAAVTAALLLEEDDDATSRSDGP